MINPLDRFLVNSSRAPEMSCNNAVFRLLTGGRLNSNVAMPVLSSTATLISRLGRCDDTENILIDIARTPYVATFLINILPGRKQKGNTRFIQVRWPKVEVFVMHEMDFELLRQMEIQYFYCSYYENYGIKFEESAVVYRKTKYRNKKPWLENRNSHPKSIFPERKQNCQAKESGPLVCKHNFRRRIIVVLCNICVISTVCKTFDRQARWETLCVYVIKGK